MAITVAGKTRRASSATTTTTTVSAVSTEVLAANVNRVGATVVNDSGDSIYLSLGGTAVVNTGQRLNANGGVLTIDESFMYTGAVNAISVAGSHKVLAVDLK